MRRAAFVAGMMVPLLAGCVYGEAPPDTSPDASFESVDGSVGGRDASFESADGSVESQDASFQAPDGSVGGQVVVEVRSIAGASGAVSVDGANCSSRCTFSPAHSSVTLASADPTFQSFAVDCPGPGCKRTTSTPLVLPMSADHAVVATFRPPVNYVFVSSVGISAAMGGLAGADSHCKARADAAGLGGTTWRALLTTSGSTASGRLISARGWMRTDGRPFLDSPAAIDSGQTFYPPRLDEFGEDVAPRWGHGFVPVWAGTNSQNPTDSSHTCEGWTSTASSAGAWTGNAASGVGWNWSYSLYACQGWQLPVYCFEIDYANPISVSAPPAGSRIAFLSQGFAPSQGGSIADADARCMADARGAGLQGNFKALLADVAKPPMDPARFDVRKGPWFRPDGVAIVNLATDLLRTGGPMLLAPIDVGADGRTHASPLSAAWTGFGGAADDYTVPGTAQTTCNGWSSSSPSEVGISSVVDFTFKSYEKLPNWPVPACNQVASLYCLQQ